MMWPVQKFMKNGQKSSTPRPLSYNAPIDIHKEDTPTQENITSTEDQSSKVVLPQRNEAHNLYNQTLHKTKTAHWKNWLENINEQNI
jgi:hypothetical protein